MSFKFDPQRLYFLPLGGSGEIGMNLNVYCYQQRMLLVDMGVSFGNQYGMDITMPDIAFLKRHTSQIAGLVLTHVHEDHHGAVPHLWKFLQCPIYATPFGVAMLKLKLKEYRIRVPDHQLIEIHAGQKIPLDPFEIELFQITHSIPESNGVFVRTHPTDESHALLTDTEPHLKKPWTVYHTGDWNLDPHPVWGEKTSLKRLKAVASQEHVVGIVGDSTNIFEAESGGSEEEVQNRLVHWASAFPGKRVVIACFASNVARIQSCLVAARKSGRKPFVLGRSLKRFDLVSRQFGYFGAERAFEPDHHGAETERGDTLIVATGSQGEEAAALSRLAYDRFPHMRLEAGDVVIFSSRVIPGNERKIFDLQNRFVKKGIQVITHKEDSKIHVSGHPSRAELQELYSALSAQPLDAARRTPPTALQRPTVIAVHGEARHQEAHVAFARSLGLEGIYPDNGSIIDLTPDKPASLVARVHAGKVFLDGKRLLPCDGEVVKERMQMAKEGVVGLTFDRLKHTCQWTFMGLFEDAQDAKSYQGYLEGKIQAWLESVSDETRHDADLLFDGLHQCISGTFAGSLRKHPLIVLHVFPDVHAKTKPLPYKTHTNTRGPKQKARRSGQRSGEEKNQHKLH